jgi:hypothetical protein
MAAEDIIGADDLEVLDMQSGDVVVVDALRQGEMVDTWALGDDAPVAGVGIVLGYDAEGDAYADASISLAEAKKAVRWGASDEEDADELRAGIGDRLEKLDGQQLERLLAVIEEGALDKAEGNGAEIAIDTRK